MPTNQYKEHHMKSASTPSITIQNLESAFAGESMAHIKYRYFAKIARALVQKISQKPLRPPPSKKSCMRLAT